MPDIAELLGSAARPPSSPLTLGGVERRARALVRRQRSLQLACAAVAVALVVPLAGLVTGSEPVGLKQVPGQSTSPHSRGPLPPLVEEPHRAGASRPSIAPGPRLLPGLTQAPSPRPTATSSPAGSPRPTGADPAYPVQTSCEVESFGLLPNQSRTCRFTASAAGGWRYDWSGGGGMSYSTYEVTVVRDGVTYTDPEDTGAKCANDAIRPGDKVTLRITQGSHGYEEFRLGAGAGFRCGTP